MDDLKTHLAAKLRTARRKKQLTQEAVAEAAGVTTETVSNSERAQSLLSLDVFFRIAQVLELDMRDLMRETFARKMSPRRVRLESDLAGVAEQMNDSDLALLIQIGRVLTGKSRPDK